RSRTPLFPETEQMTNSRKGSSPFALGLGVVLLLPLGLARADEPPLWPFDPVLPRDADTDVPASAKPHRIRLLGIQPGFLTDPVGLDDDTPPDPTGAPPQPDNGPDWFQLAMGNDNPFMDFRRPGDPGGVGYYRLYSQAKVIDTNTTACALAFQAVTPAG